MNKHTLQKCPVKINQSLSHNFKLKKEAHPLAVMKMNILKKNYKKEVIYKYQAGNQIVSVDNMVQ